MASFLPVSVRSTSVQPVKMFSRFHSDSPCRMSAIRCTILVKLSGDDRRLLVSDGRRRLVFQSIDVTNFAVKYDCAYEDR